MACPTCDHTMRNFGVENQKIFWCSRCGTLKTVNGDYEENSQTIFVKSVLNKVRTKLKYPDYGKIQETLVQATFLIKQNDLNTPIVSLDTVN